MELSTIPKLCKMKPTVKMTVLYLPMYLVLPKIAEVFKKYGGQDYIFLITAAEDSKHGPNSLHPLGLAWDIRTHDLTANQVNSIAVELRIALRTIDPQWDVVLEVDQFDTQGNQTHWGHLHIEYDFRKNV